MAFEEVAGQLGDVVLPLPERGHEDVDAAQPVVQVGAEQLPLDQPPQAAIGGGDDPDVDALRTLTAHALDGEVLNRPEQLGLRREGQVRDLVEEQGAAIGRFELAPASADAGGRALLDAE